MRFSPAATVGLLLGLALTMPGCGEERTATAGGEAAAEKPQAGASIPGNREAGRAVPRAALTARHCRHSLGEFLDSLESLGNTLAVGLSYEAYLATVNRVRGTYAATPADHLSLACLGRVAGPAEGALNLHIDAVNAWGDCLASASCDPESVEPQLQREWERAADRVALARSGLRELS